jgi:hypothetical protein
MLEEHDQRPIGCIDVILASQERQERPLDHVLLVGEPVGVRIGGAADAGTDLGHDGLHQG